MFHFFYFSFLLLRIVGRGVVVRRQEHKWATGKLVRIEQRFNCRLNPLTFNKIVASYALFIPLVSDGYTGLQGRNTNRQERERLFHYFICSSLFDDFCDRLDCPEERLTKMSFQPHLAKPNNGDEAIFLYAHILLRNIFEGERLKHYDYLSRQIYRSQKHSEQQFDPSVTDEALEVITREKGGYSLLITNLYLDIPLTDEVQDCCFHMGFLIQLINDIFDIYKDLHDEAEGSATLPNRIRDVANFDQYFSSLAKAFQTKILGIHVSHKRKKRFFLHMTALCALGHTGINQLRLVERQYGKLPLLKELPRNAVVIDMAKWRNFYYWLKRTYMETKYMSGAMSCKQVTRSAKNNFSLNN